MWSSGGEGSHALRHPFITPPSLLTPRLSCPEPWSPVQCEEVQGELGLGVSGPPALGLQVVSVLGEQ